MELIIGIVILFGLAYAMGWAFRYDLKQMEKDNPKFRKYLKDKYGW